jgi:hypothetical protein
LKLSLSLYTECNDAGQVESKWKVFGKEMDLAEIDVNN